MGLFPPKGTSHTNPRRWSNTHLRETSIITQTNNNNMNIKIKRDIYT